MAPLRFGDRHRRWPRWLLGGGVIAIIAVVTMVGFNRRRAAQIAKQLTETAVRDGWFFRAAAERSGPFSTVLRDVRLTWQKDQGIGFEGGRMELRRILWRSPTVRLSGLRGELRGGPTASLRALGALATWSAANAIDLSVTEAMYHDPVLGTVVLSGVSLLSRGSGSVLVADRVRIGSRSWRSVRLAFERHNDMFRIGWGDSVAESLVQLSCFPPSDGKVRWIVDVRHQSVRPLAARIGWPLGPDFESARIAGALSLDISDAVDEPANGRAQLVLDNWPSESRMEASPIIGSPLALVSNLVRATNGSEWVLPRLTLSTPVFDLVGKGTLGLSEGLRIDAEATGQRTCPQLRGLLPRSPERDRVEEFLAGENEKGRPSNSSHAQLDLVWRDSERPRWRFDGGCGLGSELRTGGQPH